MDKKELLKRWALAYTEPSLFYVPWKGKDIEGFLSIKNIGKKVEKWEK